jgi:hypothetical protein
MGHDISGYKQDDSSQENEIAYLRRAAWNPLARVIYEALNAEEHDCGCSGCGSQQAFSQKQLISALSKIPEGEETEPERKFLSDCIAAGGEIDVHFC